MLQGEEMPEEEMQASSSEDEPAAAERSSEEARAARVKRLKQTHAATVGRLEELHGVEAPPSGSREARARAVAQLCKDAAMAGDTPVDDLGREGTIGQGGDPAQYVAALEAAADLVADFPDWDESHYQLATAHLGAEEWDEAAAAYEAAVKINPGHAGARAALAGRAEYERMNRVREAQEMRELSLATVHAALERLPGSGGYRRNQVLLVSGLKGAPQHNGKSGKCLSFNAPKGRWTVELDTDKVIALKPENVAPEADAGSTGMICDAGHAVNELPAVEEDEDEIYDDDSACIVCGDPIGRSACFGCIECDDYTVCAMCQATGACADSPERRVQLAAEQKAAGNGAFGTGDWDRALSCYANSVGLSDACCKISAKTYSNLAATLCKLSLYTDASSCAERSTAIDPAWAKGWWRRGVVDTLQRKIMHSVQHYEKAVELEPDSEVFQAAYKKALSMISKDHRTKNHTTNEEGDHGQAEDNPGTTTYKTGTLVAGPPAVWRKVQEMGWAAWHLTNQVEGITPAMMQQFKPEGTDAASVAIRNSMTSEMFLVLGLRDYVEGMNGGLAALVLSFAMSPGQASPAAKQARDQFHRMGGTTAAGNHCLGGDPYGGFDQIFSGIVHLCGKNIWLEQHTVRPDDPDGRRSGVIPEHCLCPPHPLLPDMLAQQMIAITLMVANRHMDCIKIFGKKMLEPAAIQSAIETCKANMGHASPNGFQKATKVSVAATLKYIKKMLKTGITWDEGVRRLVSLYYRGSILYAVLMRFIGDAGGAYEHISWAVDFIEAMDKAYGVVKEGAFQEKGSAFQPSIRRSIMLMQCETHAALRSSGSFSLTGGAFPVGKEIDLCLAVIKSATEYAPHKMSGGGFGHVMHDAAFRRNPLATAHACLASLLSQMPAHIRCVGTGDDARLEIAGENFHAFMRDRGLYEHSTDLYAIIAEQYRCCAEVQFKDAGDAAILWWGHAGNMARAEGRGDGKPGNYTLGELRHAIAMAREAHGLRDELLFGEDDSAGGTFEAQALVAASHFSEEDDAFELVKLDLVSGAKPGHMAMRIGGVVVCEDMHQYVAADAARRQTKDDDKLRDEVVDEIEKEHGVAPGVLAGGEGVQKLALLCVRELHRQGHECALDEADPTEVASKLIAMAAAAAGGQ